MIRALLVLSLLAGLAHADPQNLQLPTSMNDGSAIKLAPIPVPPAESHDTRPYLFGGGAVLVAIALYMNHRTRSRDRFDRDSDRDADDLHAAAKDEPHE